jgi:hypothetical protein
VALGPLPIIGGVPVCVVVVHENAVLLVNVDENAAPVQFQQVIRATSDVPLSLQPSHT